MWTKAFIQKYPVTSFFVLTFLISWLGAFGLVASKLLRKDPIPRLDGILMFPIMIVGPACAGITLTFIRGGKDALGALYSKLNPKLIPGRWYLPLLIPPVAILVVLTFLSLTISKDYSPRLFLAGFGFGIPAGIMEEIGWMGFAFPNMSKKRTAFSNSILLGLLWGLWHLPVMDFLGTASPHGTYWLVYFLAFVAVMTAMRVIIAWVYCNTSSLLLAQLMHISSTGFLVMLSPSPLTPKQEPIWYFVYSLILCVLVVFIVSKWSRNLKVGETNQTILIPRF